MWQIWTTSPLDTFQDLSGTCERRQDLYFYESDHAHLEHLRSQFAKSGSFLVKKKNHLPKAVFFDMDATLVAQESIVELARAANQAEKVSEITEKAMNGELDFDQALKERVALLKGLDQSVLDQIRNSLTVFPGVSEFVSLARDLKIPCHVVTGGFEEIANPLFLPLGFASVTANRLEVSGGKLTGNLVGSSFNSFGKRDRLVEVASNMGIETNTTAAIGDGANDIPMLQKAGFSLAYNPKPLLIPHASGVNRTGDHRFWLKTLFYQDL